MNKNNRGKSINTIFQAVALAGTIIFMSMFLLKFWGLLSIAEVVALLVTGINASLYVTKEE